MRRSYALAVSSLLIVAAACGTDASPRSAGDGRAARTIDIAMRDIAFDPDEIDVRAGETVRLVFTNTGQVAHDAFIGDAAAQAAHGEEMAGADGHGGHGGSDDAVTVQPGQTAELTHTFDAPTELLIGCHQPGHYQAGMKTTVRVT